VLLKIEGLGPIKKGTIRVGDITLLLGPPNTGKSYTLKMLYAKLFPLDVYSQEIFSNALSSYIAPSISSESENAMYHTFKLLIDLYTHQKAEYQALSSAGIELRVYESEPFITIEARKPIDLSIDLNKIQNSVIYTVATGMLPADYVASSVLEPADILSGAEYIASTLLNAYQLGFRRISSINISDQLAPVIGGLLDPNMVKEAKVSVDVLRVQPADKNVLSVTIIPNLYIKLDVGGKELKIDPAKVDALLKQFAKRAGNEVTKICVEALSKAMYTALVSYMSYATRLDSVRFMPSNRSAIMAEIEHLGIGYLKAIEEFYPVAVSSYAYWYYQGQKLFIEGKLSDWQKKLLKASVPLIEGSLETDGSTLLYRDWRGMSTDIRTASASVYNVASVILPLLTIDGSSLILLEDPEVGLHPRTQVLMGLFITALPSLCNCRVVASTNSDLVTITVAQLAMQRPEKKDVIELIKELVPHVNEGINELAEAVSKSVSSLDVRIYEYTHDGIAKQVSLESILGERVPSISEVVDKLIEWSSDIATCRTNTKSVNVS